MPQPPQPHTHSHILPLNPHTATPALAHCQIHIHTAHAMHKAVYMDRLGKQQPRDTQQRSYAKKLSCTRRCGAMGKSKSETEGGKKIKKEKKEKKEMKEVEERREKKDRKREKSKAESEEAKNEGAAEGSRPKKKRKKEKE